MIREHTSKLTFKKANGNNSKILLKFPKSLALALCLLRGKYVKIFKKQVKIVNKMQYRNNLRL